MSLVYQSAPNEGGPGTHVFIVGVDDYPSIDQAIPGAGSLSNCCKSAERIFDWITTRFTNRRAPLASVRVLLSPNRSEKPDAPTAVTAELATRETFYREVICWAESLRDNRESIGVFFFSGHGFGLGFDRRVLALGDAGESSFAPFQGCVSFDNLYAGLAPSSRAPEMARQQYFFLDCGSSTARVPDFLERNAAHIFAIPSMTIVDDRVAPIFSAAATSGLAWARIGGLTMFSESLMSCLEGSGAEPGNAQLGISAADWVITARSLAQGLEAESRNLASKLHLQIKFSSSGLVGTSILHELQEPPTVPVRVDFSQRSENGLELLIKELPGGNEITLVLNAESRQQEIKLPAGVYQTTMQVEGAPVGTPMLLLAHPPFASVQL